LDANSYQAKIMVSQYIIDLSKSGYAKVLARNLGTHLVCLVPTNTLLL
jgi:hypothetical protein